MKNVFIVNLLIISSTPCMAMSERKFDQESSHIGAITRDGTTSDDGNDIVVAMHSMVAGKRNIFEGCTRDLYSLSPSDKKYMEDNKIKMLVYGPETNFFRLTQEEMKSLFLPMRVIINFLIWAHSLKPTGSNIILYTDRTVKHAELMREYCESRVKSNNFDELNDYLNGKLFGYDEDSISFFYERNKIPNIEKHKAETVKIFAERGIEL